ncbi:MAG TPA: hypothetical protein VK196_09810 [Magnetospirillum sp.]|nr:hypothetical protein [Magnetospirillum sp.]
MIPVSESDLLAFVDECLPSERRAEIERHLARHPADAYRVAADLALMDGLRLIFGRPLRGLYLWPG